MRKKCTSIGGQAVIEGVMMRGVKSIATAVRDDKGDIVVESNYVTPQTEKNVAYKVPVARGFLNLCSSMGIGMKSLMRSGEVFGEDAEPSKFESWLAKKTGVDIYDIVMAISVVLGVALSLFLFVFLPHEAEVGVIALIKHFTGWELLPAWVSFLLSLLEGAIRVAIFIGYIALTTLIPDVKRTYMYHGAEHKTINCYEHDLELTVENTRKMSRQHDRCGTAFMFIVMVISIFIVAVVNGVLAFTQVPILQNRWIKFLIKLVLIPIVAGVSYEVLKFMARYDNAIVRFFKAPGLWLQMLTTKEPTDDMIEVAIAAFKTVQAMDENPNLEELRFDVKKPLKKERELMEQKLKQVNADSSEVEWILSIAMNIKRSEVNSQSYIKESELNKANEILNKRLTGMPLWKVIGNTNFYGYEIDINEDVLCPRPETENLVEKALSKITDKSSVLDLCTGSGCIAIAIAKEKGANVVASDISSKALDVAKKNVEKNEVQDKVTLIESDLFEKIDGKFDVIVSNPPYIPTKEIESLDKEVKDFDPLIALDGGEDGLDVYRKIANDAKAHLNKDGYIFMECGENQSQEIEKIFADFDVKIEKDLEGVDRIIEAKVKE